MDIMPHTTALDAAIERAVDVHPAVAGAPMALRGSRRAAITATALAMAAARDADHADEARSIVLAPQLVDESAMSLELHRTRTGPIVLQHNGGTRLADLAIRVAEMPLVSDLGLDDGDTLARVEDAITRVMQIRSRAIAALELGDRDLVRWILSTAMRAAVVRQVRIADLDDADVVELMEDSLEDALAEGEEAA